MNQYPEWVRDIVREHYERIAEGTENHPAWGIADMIYSAYHKGLTEAALSELTKEAQANGEYE
jgi:hypothetical protein